LLIEKVAMKDLDFMNISIDTFPLALSRVVSGIVRVSSILESWFKSMRIPCEEISTSGSLSTVSSTLTNYSWSYFFPNEGNTRANSFIVSKVLLEILIEFSLNPVRMRDFNGSSETIICTFFPPFNAETGRGWNYGISISLEIGWTIPEKCKPKYSSLTLIYSTALYSNLTLFKISTLVGISMM
jgi:hypothetical protein